MEAPVKFRSDETDSTLVIFDEGVENIRELMPDFVARSVGLTKFQHISGLSIKWPRCSGNDEKKDLISKLASSLEFSSLSKVNLKGKANSVTLHEFLEEVGGDNWWLGETAAVATTRSGTRLAMFPAADDQLFCVFGLSGDFDLIRRRVSDGLPGAEWEKTT
jgi:hypothetical protein